MDPVEEDTVICLLPNCCFLSETSRVLAIAGALAERGVPYRVATHGGTYEHLLTDAGQEYDLIGPGLTAERCERLVRSVPGIGPAGAEMWSDAELRSYAVAEAEYFRAHGITVAVTGWILTALLSTRLAGIPLVTEHAGSWLPPLFERGGLPTPYHRLGVPLESVLPPAVRRRLYNLGADRVDLHTKGFNRVAGELGVDGVPSFAALLMGDLTLVTDVPEVFGSTRAEVDGWRPRNPRAYRPGTRLRYAGPIFATLPVPIPGPVERFLAGPGPVVYVALSSSTEALVRDTVAALRDVPARLLVAGTTHDLADLNDSRVLVGGTLPSHLIMPRVAAAVITGGQGSVQSALASGLPFAGIPLQPEQVANIVLVERQGAALQVPSRPRPELRRLPELVGRLLGDPSYRRHAQRLQHSFATVDGPGAAAEAIMQVAAEGRVAT